MGTYPPRGVRSKINTADLKDHRNIVANPSKRGMGGYIAAPGVLMNPFPEHMSEDYDAEHKAALAEAAAHKAAQRATDEKCRYISTVRPGIQLAHPSMCASSGVGVREPSSFDAMNPKQRAEVVNAARPWTQGADRVWRFAEPTHSWKHHTLSKFPEAKPDPFDDKTIIISQTPLRRLGWHRHVAAGAISESLQERKPFRYSNGVGHEKLTTSIAFSRSSLRSSVR